MHTMDDWSLMGESPLSPRLRELLASLAETVGASSAMNPELKSYRDCVYFNYFDLGLSIQFHPVDAYKLFPGMQIESLDLNRLVLETVDLYNVPRADEDNARAKSKASNYKCYPRFPIEIPLLPTDDVHSEPSALSLTGETTGKEFVEVLGEPDRKGGGTSGSIGIWCEWSKLGLMVEFGGDESRGPQAWDRGKDAIWSSVTLFAPKVAQ